MRALDRHGWLEFRPRLAENIAEERAAIETVAKGGSAVFETKAGSLGAMMLDLAVVKITAERHPNKIPTFEAWLAGHRRQ